MPYKSFEENDQHCVYKLDADGNKTGSSLGCHDMMEDADKQVKALYANEEKELENKELKVKMYDGEMEKEPYIYGAISFAEIEAAKESQEIVKNVQQMATMFPEMVTSIMYREDVSDKQAALENLATEFAERVQTLTTKETVDEQGIIERIYNKVKERFSPPPKLSSDFMLWKENGQYHWLATYSNNVIDGEGEIVSSQSHKRFVEMVDKELAPLPELWLWHRPEWKWGVATNVAYDEAGFAVASGLVDKGCEPIAEWAMAHKQLAVSHGMPKVFVKRDPYQRNIIIEHTTKEISPLPYGNAANKLTGFTILKEEGDEEMAIPEEKRKKLLESGLSEDILKALEEKNSQLSKEVDEAGLQTKEEHALTQEDLVKVIGLAVNPLTQQLATLAEQVGTITKEMATLKQADEDKVKALAEATPRDSLEELLRKEMPSLFTKETKVKPDDPLTKTGPEETEVKEKDSIFFQAWANQDRNRGRAQ